ncbi:MAG: aspartyl protease family protein [Euryarchaeota archaeon]|nr:aspartyl protease family protein [Euryarchaeota archaeon]
MGRMFVDVEIAPALEGPWEPLTVLVDTGADDSILPRPFLKKLGIKPFAREPFELANGEVIRRDVGAAFLRLKGQIGLTRVLFGAARDAPILGVIALEELALEVDPKSGQLRKARRLLVSARRLTIGAEAF